MDPRIPEGPEMKNWLPNIWISYSIWVFAQVYGICTSGGPEYPMPKQYIIYAY